MPNILFLSYCGSFNKNLILIIVSENFACQWLPEMSDLYAVAGLFLCCFPLRAVRFWRGFGLFGF